MSRPQLSVVSPVYAAEACIEELYRRLVVSCESVLPDFEILLVEDGSPDGSWEIIQRLAKDDSRVKAIRFSRNFGQHFAITAGLDNAEGEYVVVMDCDLEHDPAAIPELYRALESSRADIVWATAQSKASSHSHFKRVNSWLFRRFVYPLISSVHLDPRYSNFTMVTRYVVLQLRLLRESERSYPHMLSWLGFRTCEVEVLHRSRFAGESAYTFMKQVSYAVSTILANSNRPLHVSITVGFAISSVAVLYAIHLTVRHFSDGIAVQGWASIMIALALFSGMLLVNLGILGLYLGKAYDQVKRRPLYVMSEWTNLRPKEDQPRSLFPQAP